MRNAKLFIPVLVLMALAALPHPGGSLCHAIRSAHSFHRYFLALGPAQPSLNPVERVVYSLILANSAPSGGNRI